LDHINLYPIGSEERKRWGKKGEKGQMKIANYGKKYQTPTEERKIAE
jgi:hypothetical protein